MKEIKFNSIGKTKNYLEHPFHLFLEYENVKKKVFTNKSLDFLKTIFSDTKLYLTHSATGGLEMIANCIGIQPGDEVILPSFTFVSTATAFVNLGAIPVFIDCNMEDLNLSVDLIESAITDKTKAVVAMHYMGHPCDLLKLKNICTNHNLILIEDAATGFGSYFEGKPLGTYGDFGVISFDYTKHISAIQGGLVIINNPKYENKLDSLYNIGTNRSSYEKGEIPHYDWVDIGSKYQLNELNAYYLYNQLKKMDEIIAHRKFLSNEYDQYLRPFSSKGFFQLMPSENVKSNIHGYYLVFNSSELRIKVQLELKTKGIESVSHYRPLHVSPKGATFGQTNMCPNSVLIADRLLRLPLHNDLSIHDVKNVCHSIAQTIGNND